MHPVHVTCGSVMLHTPLYSPTAQSVLEAAN